MHPAPRNGRRSSSRMCVNWWRSSHELISPARLHHPIFRFAEDIKRPLGKQVERQRQSSQAIRQDAVANVAAACEIAGQGRWLLPGLAAAAGVLVVAIREGLMARDPQTLQQKEQQKPRGDALGKVETEAAKAGKPVSHHERNSLSPV